MSNKCIMQNDTKYISAKRPSPAYPANHCCGEHKWGNNSQLYKSTADKNSVCKWKLITPSKTARIHWHDNVRNHPSLYGAPYDFGSYSMRYYYPFDINDRLDEKKFTCGTLIDINLQSEVGLTLSNGKDYTLRGEKDITEQEKYVDSDKLFDWYKDSLDELDSVPLNLSSNNTIALMSASLFNISNIFRDGVQLTLFLLSNKQLSKGEISNVLEGLTGMEAMGITHEIRLKSNKKYKPYGAVYTRAGCSPTSKPHGNYKLTTWKTTSSKNSKTTIVGKVDDTKMPTFPIIDAVLDESIHSDNIARYRYSNKKTRIKKPSATKPKPQKECPKGKVRSPKGRCVKEKKPSATKPKPQKNCPKGKVRSPKGRCVKEKKPSATKPKPQKDCPKGKVISPKGRCIKKKGKPFPGRKAMSKLIPNCFEQTTKKYNSPKRKSPPYKANLCCDAIKVGNDNNLWLSVPNVKGICTWKLY